MELYIKMQKCNLCSKKLLNHRAEWKIFPNLFLGKSNNLSKVRECKAHAHWYWQVDHRLVADIWQGHYNTTIVAFFRLVYAQYLSSSSPTDEWTFLLECRILYSCEQKHVLLLENFRFCNSYAWHFYEWSFKKIVMSQDSYFHSIPWNFMSIENSCPHNEQGSFLFPAIKWILCSRLSCLGKPKLLYRSPIMSNFWRQFFQVTLIGCVQSCNSKTI